MGVKRRYEGRACGRRIFCDVIRMGSDYTLCVYDETAGHIGSAVLSVSRPSLTGKGVSVTSSVLNRPGHKDEEIARKMAEAVAVNGVCTAACTCGIHMDDITQEQIREVLAACKQMEREIIQDIDRLREKTCRLL